MFVVCVGFLVCYWVLVRWVGCVRSFVLCFGGVLVVFDLGCVFFGRL